MKMKELIILKIMKKEKCGWNEAFERYKQRRTLKEFFA